jgi:hypothetical protein
LQVQNTQGNFHKEVIKFFGLNEEFQILPTKNVLEPRYIIVQFQSFQELLEYVGEMSATDNPYRSCLPFFQPNVFVSEFTPERNYLCKTVCRTLEDKHNVSIFSTDFHIAIVSHDPAQDQCLARAIHEEILTSFQEYVSIQFDVQYCTSN